MSWTCPTCGKAFKHTNQWHSCARADLQDHLKNKSPRVVATVEKLLEEVHTFGIIDLNPVKTSIQVKAGATFLSIKPKRDHVEIEFQLGSDIHIDEFPVYKSIQISRNRILHFAAVESPEEIDEQLIHWLCKSYELVSG